MKRTIFALVSLLLGTLLPSRAQNINQSVQVTNDYEVKMADFRKLGPEITVPDSLYRFDYNFDYSVFDSPYKGSYDFSPYEVRLTPSPMGYDGSKLYLRAGLGYSFHPELDVVYNPVVKPEFALSVFDKGRGYGGRYHSREGVDAFSGYEYSNLLGVGGHYFTKSNTIKFGAGYDGLFTKSDAVSSSWNSAFGGARIASAEKNKFYFAYDAGLNFRYGADKYASQGSLSEGLLGIDGSVGPVINEKYSFLLDFLFEAASLRDKREGYADVTTNYAALRPHFTFNWGPVDLDAGLKADYVSSGVSSGSIVLSPSVDASLDIEKASLQIFAGIQGGRTATTYRSLKALNPFYIKTSSDAFPSSSRCEYDVYAGVRGHYESFLQYEVKAGLSSFMDSPLESLRSVVFASYRTAYVQADANFKFGKFWADGELLYRSVAASSTPTVSVFAPSSFSGNLKGGYDWLERVFVGLSLDFASARKDLSSNALSSVPGYIDIGLWGEYKFSRSFGAWAKIGNLMGGAIERHPGYIEKGSCLTIGICLNLTDF